MKLVSATCSFLWLLSAGGTAYSGAQTLPAESFEALAQRAQAALDIQPQEAVRLYQQALKTHPVWPEGWFYLGASEYQLQHFPQAAIAFRQAAELAPANGPARAFLGLAEYQVRDFERALADLQRGAALGMEGNPRFSSDVHTHLALLLARQKQFGPALEKLEPLAKAGDRSEAVITAFGLAVLQRNWLPSEVPAGSKGVVEAAGKAVWAFYAEQPNEAQASFEQLVKEYPRERGVHYAYGMFLVPRDPELALAELRRELQTHPDHLYACVESALLELKQGESRTAVELAARGVRLGPEYPLAHAVFGRALLKTGETEKAIQELGMAVRLTPQEAVMHFYLQQAYSRAGRTVDAEREKAEYYRLKTSHTATAAASGSNMQPQLGEPSQAQ